MSLSKAFKVKKQQQCAYTGGCVCLQKNGEVLFCLKEKKIAMLEIATGEILHEFENDEDGYVHFIVSPNEKYMITSSESTLIKLFDLETKEIIRVFKGHSQPVSAMAFDPSGTYLATASSDKTVRVWNYLQGFCTHYYRGHIFPVRLLQFHPSMKRLELYSCDVRGEIRCWRLKQQKKPCKAIWTHHKDEVTSIDFFGVNNNKMMTCGRDEIISVWNLEDYECEQTIPIHESLTFLKIHDGTIFYGGARGQIHQILLEDFISGHQESIQVSQFAIVKFMYSPVKQQFILIDLEHNIYLVNTSTLQIDKLICGYNDQLFDIKFTNDNRVVMATNSQEVRVVSLDGFSTELLRGHTDHVSYVSVCKKNGYIVTASKDKTARIWDLNGLKCLAVCTGHLETVSAVCCFHHEFTFVTASKDRTVKLWKLDDHSFKSEDPETLQTSIGALGHEKEMTCLDVKHDDSLIASGGLDKNIKLWSKELVQMTNLRGHRRAIYDVTFSKTENTLASSSGDKTIKLWSLDDYACLRTFEGHTEAVNRTCFINGGLQMLSGCNGGLLKLWNLKTSLCMETFEEHEMIWSMDVSTTGQIITGDGESLLNVWEDITEDQAQEEFKTKEEHEKITEDIKRYTRQNDYISAGKLCIQTNRPRQLFFVLKKLYNEKIEQSPLDLLKQLEKTELCDLIIIIQDWLTNSKYCYLAIQILHSILMNYKPETISELPWKNFNKVLKTLAAYSERHLKRVEGVMQKTFLMNFTLDCMGFLEADENESKKRSVEDVENKEVRPKKRRRKVPTMVI